MSIHMKPVDIPFAMLLALGAATAALTTSSAVVDSLAAATLYALGALLCIYGIKRQHALAVSAGASPRKAYLGALVFVGLMLVALYPQTVFAQDPPSIGDIADKVEDSVVNIRSLAINATYTIGTVLLLVGMYLLYKNQKEENRGHLKTGLISMLVGFLMVLAPQTIGVIGETTGIDPSDLNKNIRETDAAKNF